MAGHCYFTTNTANEHMSFATVQEALIGDAGRGMFGPGVRNVRESGRSSALFECSRRLSAYETIYHDSG